MTSLFLPIALSLISGHLLCWTYLLRDTVKCIWDVSVLRPWFCMSVISWVSLFKGKRKPQVAICFSYTQRLFLPVLRDRCVKETFPISFPAAFVDERWYSDGQTDNIKQTTTCKTIASTGCIQNTPSDITAIAELNSIPTAGVARVFIFLCCYRCMICKITSFRIRSNVQMSHKG